MKKKKKEKQRAKKHFSKFNDKLMFAHNFGADDELLPEIEGAGER